MNAGGLPPVPAALAPRLFALIAGLSRRSGPPPADLAALSDAEFCTAFHSLATRHGVLGLVLTRLASLPGFTALDPGVQRRILAPLKILRQQALLLDMERDRVVGLLMREGLRPLVLKGAALRGYAYRDPVERQVGDLDLLLAPDQVDAATAALQGAGYRLPESAAVISGFRQHHFHLPLSHPGGFDVELHWALDPPHEMFSLDPAGFLARGVRVSRPEGEMLTPSPTDTLLHMTSQNTEDCFSKLRRLVDVDRIVARGEVDWDHLREEARQSGLEVVLGLTLALCGRLLDTPSPPGFIASLGISRSARRHLALLQPESWLTLAAGPRHHLGTLTLALWSTSRGRRREYVRRVVRGDLDPLAWLWQGKQRPERPPRGPVAGAALAVRLAAYHLFLWGAAPVRLVTPAGRASMDIWSPHGPGTGRATERSLAA